MYSNLELILILPDIYNLSNSNLINFPRHPLKRTYFRFNQNKNQIFSFDKSSLTSHWQCFELLEKREKGKEKRAQQGFNDKYKNGNQNENWKAHYSREVTLAFCSQQHLLLVKKLHQTGKEADHQRITEKDYRREITRVNNRFLNTNRNPHLSERN